MVILLLSSQPCTSSWGAEIGYFKIPLCLFTCIPVSFPAPSSGRRTSILHGQGPAPCSGLRDQEVSLWSKWYFSKYLQSLITTKIFQTFLFFFSHLTESSNRNPLLKAKMREKKKKRSSFCVQTQPGKQAWIKGKMQAENRECWNCGIALCGLRAGGAGPAAMAREMGTARSRGTQRDRNPENGTAGMENS